MRRASWTYKQPLTRKPHESGAPVSDLFVWRNSSEWETFFEITSLPALFEGTDDAVCMVTLAFFDAAGELFCEKTTEIIPNRRHTLGLSKIIGNEHGEVGTFAVFHTHTPQSLTALGSHLSERGYVSYRYRCASLRSYVHGNLDAIARLSDKSLELLGGESFRPREYSLQHALGIEGTYELAIVNPTQNNQKVVFKTMSSNSRVLDSQVVNLPPSASHLFKVKPQHEQQRIVIRSRLIMARPLVFRIQNQTMDVFHG